MKAILSLIISGALVVSGFGQTRNVLVGTNNTVVQPTNFWSANSSDARNGLGLGSIATNSSSSFQPSSSVLSNLASSNGANLTNISLAGVVGALATNGNAVNLTNFPANLLRTNGSANGLTNFPTSLLATNGNGAGLTNLTAANIAGTVGLASNVTGTIAISNGGTGATNIAGARTNLGLGATWLTNTVASNFRTAIGATTIGNALFTATNSAAAIDAIGISTNFGDQVLSVSNIQINQFPAGVGTGFVIHTSGQTLQVAGTNVTTATPAFYGWSGFQQTAFSAAQARTNIGLSFAALTNTNTAGFNASLYGTNTNPVLVNTNGEVVSPTNFWQVAPIQTLVQDFTLIGGTQTNNATNARNLYVYSLNTNLGGVSNTIILPTNAATFNGDEATVVHKGTTNTTTVIRQAGSTNNLITLSRFDESVKFIRELGQWDFYHNISFVEPIQFSGINASANAAASRTNLGLGTTNDVQFGRVFVNGIFEAASNRVEIFQPILITDRDSTNAVFQFEVGSDAAIARTNLGLGATNVVAFLSLITANTNGSLINLDPAETLGQSLTGIGKTSNSIYFTYASFTYLEANTNGWTVHKPFSFSSDAIRLGTLTNLQLASTNIVTFAGITNNGDITINQTTASNGLLYIRRTNNEAFLGLANLIASNNTTVSNETLFRVGVAEATNRSAQFGFRSTNTNGNGVAVFSVFGYNALMMIGPSDPAAGTNPIEATVYSVNPTNKVMTLIKTNTGATLFHRAIEFEGTTNQAVTRTNLGLGATNNVTFSALTLSSDLTLGSGDNIVLSTTTGTKIGTATNQLLGFYNQTPITQPSSTGLTNGFSGGGGGATVHPQSTFTGNIGTNAYTISDIVAHLKSLGLIAP